MYFDLVDRVLEQTEGRIVTIKHVTAAEEYLQDHFPGFPVLPGVMMLEAMVQAARRLLGGAPAEAPWVLGRVRGLKYGRFVKPGATIRVEVERIKEGEGGSIELRGEVRVLEPEGGEAVAASGKLTMRRARVAMTSGGAT